MTVKGVFLFLLLLLSGGTSFAFQDDSLHFDEQENLLSDSQFEEETVDLYHGTVSSFKTNVFHSFSFTGGKNFLLQSFFETRSQEDYIKRSKKIDPGLDVPAIIFPFHVFL